MDTTSQTEPTHHQRANQPLTALLDTVEAAQWGAPSPCDGWTARDVVRHLVDTQREFLTSHGADLGAAPDVDSDPAVAWRDHAGRVADLLADGRLADIAFDGYFGPTTVGKAFEQFYLFDMVAHRWDIARAVGRDASFTDAELDELEAGIASFGDALYAEGICRQGVQAPDGADRQTRVLAQLGRTAG